MESFELEEYLSNSAERIINDIVKASFVYPKAAAFMMKYALYGRKARALRQKAEKNGEHIPPFLIASITNQCNLHCKDCFARANHTCSDESFGQLLSERQWGSIFSQAKDLGIGFVLLIGGEPLLRRDVIEEAGKWPEILFPIITNATLIDESYLDLFSDRRNLVPILSIEGKREETDGRRGVGIYQQLEQHMQKLKSKKLLFGTSITVTKENMEEVLSDKFVGTLSEFGCKSVIYVEYVPVNEAGEALTLDDQDRELMAGRLGSLREQYDSMLLLSFPGDEKSFGGCLAAGRGFFHINAQGGAEPCPFSPYSDTNLAETSLKEALKSPLFTKLNVEGILNEEHIGGCTLFAKDSKVRELVRGGVQ